MQQCRLLKMAGLCYLELEFGLQESQLYGEWVVVGS